MQSAKFQKDLSQGPQRFKCRLRDLHWGRQKFNNTLLN
jgi:hypothetical protein